MEKAAPLVEHPGYCYLHLFKSTAWKTYEWPTYPSWVDIIMWNEDLRDLDDRVTIRQVSDHLFHVSKDNYSMQGWSEVRICAYGRYGDGRVGVGLGTLFLKYIHSYFPVFGPGTAQIQVVPETINPDQQGVTEAMINANQAAIGNVVAANNRVIQMRNNLARDTARAVRGVIEEMRPPPRPVQPALKLEMPDYYEGDPMQIANWIRSMETYFHLTKLSDFEQKS